MTEPTFNDLEQLSAYLDGKLSGADGARLESRIMADPDLRSVYEGLRQTRSLLRQLPTRRAPRNFRLTPQMVGIKPTLPRSFPIFRLASVFSSILLFIGYALNLSAVGTPLSMLPAMSAAAPAPTASAFDTFAYDAPTETSIAEAAAEPTQETQATAPNLAPSAATSAETPVAKQAVTETATSDIMSMASEPSADMLPQGIENTQRIMPQPLVLPIHPGWLFGLLGLAVVSGASAYTVRMRAERRAINMKDILLASLALMVTLLLAAGINWMFMPQ